MKATWGLVLLGLVLGAPQARAIDADVPDPTPARDKIVDWVKEHNRFGPEANIVTDMANAVDGDIKKVNNLSLVFGKGLTKEEKAYQLDVWAGSFFATELTDEQAEKMGIKEKSVDLKTGTKKLDKRVSTPLVELKDLSIDDADKLDGSKKITGKVACEVKDKPPADNLAVRISYMVGTSTRSSFHYLDKGLSADDSTVSFSFDPVNSSDEDKKFSGPVLMFLELATVSQSGGNVEITILSNTVPILVDVASADN